MEVSKSKSLEVSEKFMLSLENFISLSNANLDLYYRVFNNNREEGYMLTVNSLHDYQNELYIWAYESRNSDDIVVVVSKEIEYKNMFNETAWNERQNFKAGDYDYSACAILEQIKSNYPFEFNVTSSYTFELLKDFDYIKNISNGSVNLDSSEEIKLARFEFINTQNLVDLVIKGDSLYFNIYFDNGHKLELLSSNTTTFTGNNEIELMLKMKENLNNYFKEYLNVSINGIGGYEICP